MNIVLYMLEATIKQKITTVISLLHNDSTCSIHSPKELLNHLEKGIDILFLPPKFDEIAIYLGSINYCMQFIYLVPSTIPMPVPNSINAHILRIPFSAAQLTQILNDAREHSHLFKKTFIYTDHGQKISIPKRRIIYIKSVENHAVCLYLKNTQATVIKGNIPQITSYFPRPHFVIPHPLHIVRLDEIALINETSITLKTKDKIPLITNLRASVISDYFSYYFQA